MTKNITYNSIISEQKKTGGQRAEWICLLSPALHKNLKQERDAVMANTIIMSKYQGLGNDYLILDPKKNRVAASGQEDRPSLPERICLAQTGCAVWSGGN